MRRRERVFVVLLSPALIVLALVTLAPFAFLILTSLTPLNLAKPATWWDFHRPLTNFVDLPQDGRFLNSLGVQLRLSAFTVLGQLLLGLGAALLLNRRSRVLEAIRALFIIPMVLPPIVVAIIWKVLFTPDISVLNWVLGLAHLPQPAWLAEQRLAGHRGGGCLGVVSLHPSHAACRRPDDAGRAHRGGADRRRRHLAGLPPRSLASAAPRHRGHRALPVDREREGVSPHLHHDRGRTGHGDGGHELLRVPPGLHLQPPRILRGHQRGGARGHLPPELRDRALGRDPGRCRVSGSAGGAGGR